MKKFARYLMIGWLVVVYVGFAALAFAAGYLPLFAAAVVLLVPSAMTVFCAMHDIDDTDL